MQGSRWAPTAASMMRSWPTSPSNSENINFFGAVEVEIDAELAQLGPTGYRPLRVRDTLF
jgi:hypothetical protein